METWSTDDVVSWLRDVGLSDLDVEREVDTTSADFSVLAWIIFSPQSTHHCKLVGWHL